MFVSFIVSTLLSVSDYTVGAVTKQGFFRITEMCVRWSAGSGHIGVMAPDGVIFFNQALIRFSELTLIQQALFQQRLHNVQRDPVIALAFKLLLSQLH